MSRHHFAALGLIVLIALPLSTLVVNRHNRSTATTIRTREAAATFTEHDERGNRLILEDENGVIPIDAHFKASMHRQRLAARTADSAADAGIMRASWSFAGPTNLSGRIRTIVIHPTRTTHLLAGAATGGVWKSTDAGVTWRAVNDFLPALAIRTLAINPANPEQVYAGTGEVVLGVGILRSNDFGETWQHVAGTETMGTVYRIRFTPDGGTLYVAAVNGVYRMTDGTTFNRIHGGAADDIEIDPSNPLRVIASAWFDGRKSILQLSGNNWTASTGAPALSGYSETIELAFAPSNPQIVYALTSEPSLSQGRFYRSADGGSTFQFASNAPLTNGASWASALWVNPFDSNSILAGGVSMGKSTDGGSTWTNAWSFSTCTPREVCVWGPVDFHEVVSHPSFDNASNRLVYIVADQGVFQIPDVGQNRLEARLGGLNTFQFYAGAVDQTSGRILAGTQDVGGHLFLDGQTTSDDVIGGDVGFVAIDPRDPNVFYTTNLGGGITLDLLRHGGPEIWVALMRCNEPAFRLHDSCDRTANREAPLVMDLLAPDRLYAGGLRLSRTDNARDPVSPTSGPTWTDLGLPSQRTGNYVSAIAVSPLDSNVVWAARNAGEIYLTTNATAPAPTWVRVGQSQLPTRRPTRITIAAQNPRMVYVTFGGYAANVWRTFDNGTNWENASGGGATGLPLVPVRDLEIHPAADGAHWIYAATEIGLFASEDAGLSWFVPSSGPAAVRIDDLMWRNQTLILATHGRGLWKAAVGNATPMTLPAAPISFVANVSSGTLTASWAQSPIGATPQQYVIEASLNANFTPIIAALPAGAATSLSVPGVPPGIFYLRVIARNAAGVSIPSNVQVIGGTPIQLPAAPTNLAANVNGNTLTLTWSPGSGGGAVTTYYIDAGSAAGSSNIASVPTGNTQTSFAVTAPNGLYFVRVRAGNAAGTSGTSNEVSFRIGPEPCTIPPQNPTNVLASVAGSVVTLTWTPPTGPGLTGYRLEAGSAAGLANLAVLDLGTATTFTASAPRGTYFVRVRALSACGPSGPSADVTVVIP